MSRSRNKNLFFLCPCCVFDSKKNNRKHRRKDKQNLKSNEFEYTDHINHGYFKKLKGFTVPKIKVNPREEAEWKAKHSGKTKKEILALEKKYYHRLMSK